MSQPISGKLVDGLFRKVLATDVTAELRESLLTVGLDLSAPTLEPQYPRTVWYRAIESTAQTIFAAEQPERQLRRLGLHVIASLQTRQIVKSTWISMARLLGPRRALRQVADHLDHSPVKLAITEKTKTQFEIVVEELEQTEFLAGLLEGTIGMLGGKEVRAVVIGPTGNSTVFSATWR